MRLRHRQEARALDKEGEIDVEAMGRIDFLGHPELRNPFLYGHAKGGGSSA
jgi:hypothetical protein